MNMIYGGDWCISLSSVQHYDDEAFVQYQQQTEKGFFLQPAILRGSDSVLTTGTIDSDELSLLNKRD